MRLDGSSILFPPQKPSDAWLAEESNYGPDHKFAYCNERPSRCRKCGRLSEDHA